MIKEQQPIEIEQNYQNETHFVGDGENVELETSGKQQNDDPPLGSD